MSNDSELAILQEVVNQLVAHNGNKSAAADACGMARTTYRDALARADKLGVRSTVLPPDGEALLAEAMLKRDLELSDLRKQVKNLTQENLTQNTIREHIFKLPEYTASPPSWAVNVQKNLSKPGVPFVIASDWHLGEVVNPRAVDGINEYNLEIADQRWRNFTTRVIDLCFNHMVNPDYPGLVFALGGDMVAGHIHDELTETNDGHTMEHVFKFFDMIVWSIDEFKKHFKQVFIPCAYGNHGRNTKAVRYKAAAVTNFDWLLYTMLERHYRKDPAVTISVPISFDSYFQVNGVHFVLTHGDRLGVRGGDGIIGLVGPVTRGVKKLTASYASLNKPVDYVLMGHWHQHLRLKNAIVNSSGKGYDEFGLAHRFDPEPPTQQLFWVHPKYEITFECPIYLDDVEKKDVVWAAIGDS